MSKIPDINSKKHGDNLNCKNIISKILINKINHILF